MRMKAPAGKFVVVGVSGISPFKVEDVRGCRKYCDVGSREEVLAIMRRDVDVGIGEGEWIFAFDENGDNVLPTIEEVFGNGFEEKCYLRRVSGGNQIKIQFSNIVKCKKDWR
jgi:hypothetical protein